MEAVKVPCSALKVAPDVTLYHVGPSLDHGPLPTLFYFSISGPDSLTLDPYNQIVQFLSGHMVRVFSMTLPGHEGNLPAVGAMKIWADDLSSGKDCIANFLEQAKEAIAFAIKERFIDPKQMSIAGLSRGAFMAAHIAAQNAHFRKLLCFAPLTKLSKIKEFAKLHDLDLANQYDLVNIAKDLGDRHIRLYIGNEDTRVGTNECFQFLSELVKHKQQRASQTELFIYPSIGQMGHGTPPEIFQQGASWILS